MKYPWRAGLLALCVAAAGAGASFDFDDSLAGYASFQFLEEPTNPALVGMGDAGSAAAANGFSYYNPALPLLKGKSYLSLEYGSYPAGDLRAPHFEGAAVFDNWFAGLSFSTFSIGDIYMTSEQGENLNETLSWQETFLTVAAGYARQGFSFGVGVSGMQSRISARRAYGLAGSVGMTYAILPGKLRVGLAGLNLGAATDMVSVKKRLGDGAPLPATARLGISWDDTLKSIGYAAACDLVYRHVDHTVTVPLGIEIRPVKPLAIRLGKRIGHDTELFNCGLGLRVPPLSADIGFVFPRLVSSVEPKFSIGITYELVAKQPGPPKPAEEVKKPRQDIEEIPLAPLPDSTPDSAASPGSSAQQPDSLGSGVEQNAQSSEPSSPQPAAGAAGEPPPHNEVPAVETPAIQSGEPDSAGVK